MIYLKNTILNLNAKDARKIVDNLTLEEYEKFNKLVQGIENSVFEYNEYLLSLLKKDTVKNAPKFIEFKLKGDVKI